MAIVQYLSSLKTSKLPKIRPIHFDDLQQKVRANFYLELPQLDDSYCILSPTLNPIGNNYEERIETLLQSNPDILHYLKERLMYTLVRKTAILEACSYFLEQNDYLLLARLKYFREVERVMEIKLYTSTHKDLTEHYSDKIYIGRCFLNLEKEELPYQGLNLSVLSLMDQYEFLKQKAAGKLDNPEKYHDSYFLEIQELINEVVSEVISVLDSVPPAFEPERWTLAEAIRIKGTYRGIIHMLLELAEEVVEFENVLMHDQEDRFARYVTKYKKDLKNIINYVNFNVMSRLSIRIQQG